MVALPSLRGVQVAPRTLWRIAAVVVAAGFLAPGFLALADYSAAAGIDAGAAAAAADGRLRVSGEVANVCDETSPPATIMFLRGGSGLKFHFDGTVGHLFAVGEFVTIEGTKAGSVVEGDSVVRGVHPLGAALPYFVVGFAVVGFLTLDFFVPWWLAGDAGSAEPGGRLRALFRRGPKAPDPEIEGGPGSGDNHSGAPAPKG
jgi:hypothetical protein